MQHGQVAYRSFARKHEMTKANLRRKTALLRVLESRLDKREDALHELHERSQEKARRCGGLSFHVFVWRGQACVLAMTYSAFRGLFFFFVSMLSKKWSACVGGWLDQRRMSRNSNNRLVLQMGPGTDGLKLPAHESEELPTCTRSALLCFGSTRLAFVSSQMELETFVLRAGSQKLWGNLFPIKVGVVEEGRPLRSKQATTTGQAKQLHLHFTASLIANHLRRNLKFVAISLFLPCQNRVPPASYVDVDVKVAALKGALVDFAEGRSGTDRGITGPDGAAGPERGLTITRAREIAAKVSELTAALEVRFSYVICSVGVKISI